MPNGDCRLAVAPFFVNPVDYFGVGSCCRNVWDNSVQSAGCSQFGAAANCPGPSQETTKQHAQQLYDVAAAALTSALPFNTFVARRFDSSGQIVAGLVGEVAYHVPPIYTYAACNNPMGYLDYIEGVFSAAAGAVTYTKVYGQWAAVRWLATINNRISPGPFCHPVTYTPVECQTGQPPQAGQLIRLEAPPSLLETRSGLRQNACLVLDQPVAYATFWTVQKDASCSNLAP